MQEHDNVVLEFVLIIVFT